MAYSVHGHRGLHTCIVQVWGRSEEHALRVASSKSAWHVPAYTWQPAQGEGVATSRFLQKHSKRLGFGEKNAAPVVQLAMRPARAIMARDGN